MLTGKCLYLRFHSPDLDFLLQEQLNTTEKYGIIIIGAGITGLSTGLAWTRVYGIENGIPLIIEKQPVAGGCVSTFARHGFRFDTVQIIPDVSDVLQFLGINIELLQFTRNYARLFLVDPAKGEAEIFPVAAGCSEFREELIRRFPAEEKRIGRFFRYCEAMHAELAYLKTEPGFMDILRILVRCRRILINSGRTYRQFLRSFGFRDPRIYEVLDIFSSFSGLSGNRCAALLTACAMVTTLRGSYRPMEGFITFPHRLRREFETRGGEVLLRTEVAEILCEEGVATGVRLRDGRVLEAEYVVSTADSKVTLGKMVGFERIRKLNAAYARKASEASMSPSGFAIHLGLDDSLDLKELGFDCGYNVLTTGYQTHEKAFDLWEKGESLMEEDAFHLAVIAPSVMTGGKNNLIIHVVPAPGEKWIRLRAADEKAYMEEKEGVATYFIRKVEQYMIPGLSEHIVFRDISTPATYARYINSPTGSNYDMMPVPGNFGKNRLPTRTPVKNLFLPKFSHGIWPSLQAGLQVVDMISGGKIMQGNSSYS